MFSNMTPPVGLGGKDTEYSIQHDNLDPRCKLIKQSNMVAYSNLIKQRYLKY